MTDETAPAAYTSPPITAKPNSVEERLAKLEKLVAAQNETLVSQVARINALENGYVKQELAPEPPAPPEPAELVLALAELGQASPPPAE